MLLFIRWLWLRTHQGWGSVKKTDISADTKVILMLCGVFGKGISAKPLTQSEYSSLARCLVKFELRPCDLLEWERMPDIAQCSGIDIERLEALLARGMQLGISMEEWHRNGIRVVTRSEADYPGRLRSHLKDKAPPLLFCIGNPDLLTGGGIAVVGSRNVDGNGEMFTRKVARLCAISSVPVVSGSARGVDQIAMNACLEAGGSVIGVVADNLLKKSLERSARKYISSGKLLLISPYHPIAGFSVGTAMARNKLIYAMADYGLVVSADSGKGGTWAGAKEELSRKNANPVFVRTGDDIPDGNRKLLNMGALGWPDLKESCDIAQELNGLASRQRKDFESEQPTLFDFSDQTTEVGSLAAREEPAQFDKAKRNTTAETALVSIYDAVLPVIISKLQEPLTAGELALQLDVSKTQLSAWLKRAVAEKAIRKLSKPVRYVTGIR